MHGGAGGRRGRLWVAMCGVLAVALTASCQGGDEVVGDTFRIGLVTDLSSPQRGIGTDLKTAVELAKKKINDAGGINGIPLDVIVKDSGLEPERAVLDFRTLANQDGVVAVIGPIASTEAEAAFSQAASLRIPVITGTATKEGITESGRGWAFRNTADNTRYYRQSIPVFMRHYAVRRVALVYDEQAPIAPAADVVVPVAAQFGIQIVDERPFRTQQTDFTSIVQWIKGLDIDGLIVISFAAEAGLLATELERQGVTDLPVLGHPAQNTPTLQANGGDAIHDWVLPTIFFPDSPDASAATQAYVKHMASLDSQPPTFAEAANYYDIVQMIAQVAEEAGLNGDSLLEDARQAVRDGLAGLTDFQGVTGPTSFLPNGDAEKPVYTIVLNGTQATLLR